MTTNRNPDPKQLLGQIDSFFTTYLAKKAPSLPAGVKEFLVKFGPYFYILVILLSIVPVLALLGITALFAPVAYMGGIRAGTSFSLAGLFLLATLVLDGLAIPGLLKRSLNGWNLLFYSTLVGAVYSILSMNLSSLIIGTGISLYFLYQIKSYYK